MLFSSLGGLLGGLSGNSNGFLSGIGDLFKADGGGVFECPPGKEKAAAMHSGGLDE